MEIVPQSRTERVGRALARVAVSVSPSGGTAWRAVLRNGKEIATVAELSDRWLRIASDVTRPLPRADHWHLLQRNDGLPPDARITLAPHRRHPWLRVDIPLWADGQLDAYVERACRCLVVAVERVAEPPSTASVGLERPSPAATASIAEQLVESGWSHRLRDDGSLDVDLEARRGLFRARVHALPDESRLAVTVASAAVLAPVCQAAVGTFLLLGTDTTRCVRGVARREEAAWAVTLEARLPATPSREDLDLALVTLGLAADSLADEARALLHEPAAVRYLATMRGGP
jgi:hypothetical protein